MKRVHVVVHGRVQGVGYRYSMRIQARAAGASGWVRNRRDGTVEAEVEGDPEVVSALLTWMRQGPPGSDVTAMDVSDLSPAGGRSFEVLGTQ